MSKQKKIVLGVILVVILLMSIGYAALENITLTISGTASATAAQDNFKVYFTGANTVKNPNTDDIEVIANDGAKTAEVNISGLSTVKETAYAILEIKNASNGIKASEVNVTTDAVDTTVFDIKAEMCTADGTAISDYSVAADSTTYVKVSATLLQTPTVDTSTSISVTITAKPEKVQ